MGKQSTAPTQSSVLITFSDLYSNETLLVIEVYSEPVLNVDVIHRLGIPESDVECLLVETRRLKDTV